MRILLVAGARPNFIKIAPLMAELGKRPAIEPMLVHTGQHYDERMSEVFFRQLGIPEPDINLEVGSGSHASQTAEIMRAFEPVLEQHRPDAVLVVGDVNSTIACGLVAKKMGLQLIHVEAGLRSFDRSMPEEINRVLTDAISDLLFCSEQSGVENLRKEGIAEDKIFLVGNVMIDTLLRHRDRADGAQVRGKLGLHSGEYAVVTLHRPVNVDDPARLGLILHALERIGEQLPVVLPAHPRLRQRLGVAETETSASVLRKGIHVLDPLGYLEFLCLMTGARVVLTDSGGIQEETTILGVPCLTLRENTERPVTLTLGTNRLVGSDPERILAGFQEVMNGAGKRGTAPPLWDGRAAERIASILEEKL